jgi:hypothetical protein
MTETSETIALCDYFDFKRNFSDILSSESKDKNVKKREVPEKLSLVHLTYSPWAHLRRDEVRENVLGDLFKGYKKGTYKDYMEKVENDKENSEINMMGFYNPFKKGFWKGNLFAKSPLIGSLLIDASLISMCSNEAMLLVPPVIAGFLGSEIFREFRKRYFLKEVEKEEYVASYVEKIISLDDSDVKSICVPKAQKRVGEFELNTSKLPKGVPPDYKTIRKDLKKIYDDYFKKNCLNY